jgi:flagellar biosynthesis activator protein FlaF
MRSAAQAYGTVARQVASPRELEATLLLKAASRLQDGWERTRPELDDAPRYNRKL